MDAGFTDVRTLILPAPRPAPDPVAGRTGRPRLGTMLVVARVSGPGPNRSEGETGASDQAP